MPLQSLVPQPLSHLIESFFEEFAKNEHLVSKPLLSNVLSPLLNLALTKTAGGGAYTCRWDETFPLMIMPPSAVNWQEPISISFRNHTASCFAKLQIIEDCQKSKGKAWLSINLLSTLQWQNVTKYMCTYVGKLIATFAELTTCNYMYNGNSTALFNQY